MVEQDPASGFNVTIGRGGRRPADDRQSWRALAGSDRNQPADDSLLLREVRDGNPSYWDEAFAQRQWDNAIPPSAMLASWLLPLGWQPHPAPEFEPLAMQVPLPGSSPVDISTDTEVFQKTRVGNRLIFSEQLVDISAETTNRLEGGHFATVGEYRNQHGLLLARATDMLFRFTPHAQLSGAAK